MPPRRSSPSSPILHSSSSSSVGEVESYELSKRPHASGTSIVPAPPEDFMLDEEEEEEEEDDLEASSSPSRGLLGASRNKNRSARRRSSLSGRRKCLSYLSSLRLCYRRTSSVRHRCYQLWMVLLVMVGCLVVFTFIFNPSYTKKQYPEKYSVVADAVSKGGGVNPDGFWRKKGVKKTKQSGRGNPAGEKVFIAANIISADLINGAWGNAVMELMDLLGEENVFLSWYSSLVAYNSGCGKSLDLLTLHRHIRERLGVKYKIGSGGPRRVDLLKHAQGRPVYSFYFSTSVVYSPR